MPPLTPNACALAAALVLLAPPAAHAQGGGAEAQIRARFRQFDINESGWLSGREVTACECRDYDADGNGEITWQEFYRADLRATVAKMARDAGLPDLAPDPEPRRAPAAPPRQAAPAAPAAAPRQNAPAAAPAVGTAGLGDPVKVEFDGIPYSAWIVGQAGGRYHIRYDGPMLGRPDDEWVGVARIKNIDYSQYRPDFIAPAPVPGRTYQLAERVAVNFDGTWYAANIVGAEGGRYQVQVDSRTSSDRWFTANDLRPVGPRRPDRPTPVAGLPRTVASGRYECTTIAAGFGAAMSTRMTMGELRITGPDSYTGVTKQGAGAAGRYAYDPATGAVEWGGGRLLGLDAVVESTTYGLNANGQGSFDVVYRLREGGHRYNLNCDRR